MVFAAAASFGVSVACANQQPASEVLVHYANETAPDEHEAESWDTILAWLNSSEHAKTDEIAEQLRRDCTDFHGAVDRQIEDLHSILTRPSTAPTAVVFTNRLVCGQTSLRNRLWLMLFWLPFALWLAWFLVRRRRHPTTGG